MAVIGIDLGGTKTAGIVLDGENVAGRYRIDTDASSQQSVLAGLLEVSERMRERAEGMGLSVEALGLGIAGFIDYERGVVTDAPNHPLKDAHVKEILEVETGLAVFVDNDANVAALAEARLGAGRGARYLVHLTLGTGIGGGIIIDGCIYRGALGAAAELGHMIVVGGGPPWQWGARGGLVGGS